MLAALARTAPCRRPQTPLLIARLLPQPPLPLLSLRCWSSAAPPPQQQPSQQPQNHQQQQPAQQPDANNVGKGATLTPSAPSRLSSAALRALDPLRSAIPAASPSIFTFFSNTEIHKRCSKEGERNATERDPDVGALKSRQKHDRHDAVVADETMKKSVLLQGSTRVVLTAMVSNTCLAAMKFYAALSTNSPSMFAEGIHSLADLLNEALLFFGVMRASRQPDSLHPYGFSRERYAWSLVSGCGIFFLGGGVSLYHGITGIMNPHLAGDLHLAFMVLAGSAVFEGGTAFIALRQVRKAASDVGMSVLEYVKKGADPTAVQILLEDTAAISGIAVASTCLTLAHVTGNPIYDAIGSCAIGGILGTTAVFLIRRNMSMLVETSMQPSREMLVVTTLLADPVVKSVHDVKSTAIGIEAARFKAEVQFDGELVAARALQGVNLDRELEVVRALRTKEELDAYLQNHGSRVVDQLAEEVDRLEIRIKKRVPEVKHCDLEIL